MSSPESESPSPQIIEWNHAVNVQRDTMAITAQLRIELGKDIIMETCPLIVRPSRASESMAEAFCAAVANGTDSNRALLDNLPRAEDGIVTTQEKDAIAAWCITSLICAEQRHAMVRRYSSFKSRSFDLGDGAHGVFALSSFLQHSCMPNCYAAYDPVVGKMAVRVIRRLRKHDALAISFIGSACSPLATRTEALMRRGMQCVCRACTGPMSICAAEMAQALRKRIHDACGTPMERFNLDSLAGITKLKANVARNAAKSLAEGLCEAQMYGLELCQAYRVWSLTSLKCRLYYDACRCALWEAEVEESIMGDQTTHLRKYQDSARNWAKYVTTNKSRMELAYGPSLDTNTSGQ